MAEVLAPLSAAALGIETWEHAALLSLVPQLGAGTVRVDMTRASDIGIGCSVGALVAAAPGAPAAVAAHPFLYECGIGGAVCASASPALRPLFAPGSGQPLCLAHPGWRARPAQLARAIAAFLGGAGARCWAFMHGESADG